MSEANFAEWINFLEDSRMLHADKINELVGLVDTLIAKTDTQQQTIEYLQAELADAKREDPRIAEAMDKIKSALSALDPVKEDAGQETVSAAQIKSDPWVGVFPPKKAKPV